MKTLKTTFRKNGYDYNMVFRSDVSAIFEQKWCGGVIAYEVIRIQNLPGGVLPNGKLMEEGEYYPPSEKWGTDGWTVPTLERAYEKIEHIKPVQKREKPQT